jgi:hypothetical protein
MVLLTVWSLLALAPFAFTGCHVGSADDTGDGSSSPDASGGGDGDGTDAASNGPPTGCVDFATENLPDGHHPERYEFQAASPGCISVSCHGEPAGAAAPQFTVAGSLYSQRAQGGNPVAGAHVFVIDANNKVIDMITASNGFFYTQEAVAQPLTTFATGCPDRLEMASPANGNCSFGQCHGENYKAYLASP